MRSAFARICSAAVLLGLLSAGAAAENWPRFRGPNGAGVSDATTVPVRWSDGNYNRTADLPGVGHGSPVAWNDRVFVQCEENDGRRRLLVCLDAHSGEPLWTRGFDADTHRKHAKNSFASSTPALDAEHVYLAWAVPGKLSLAALTHAGELVWQRDLGDFKGGHDFAASPIVYEDLVVLGNDQDGSSSLLALDRRTGETRWSVPRRSRRTTYSTPCVYEAEGRAPELIFTNWEHGITAVDPESGRVNWEIAVFDPDAKERAIGSPVVAGDLIIGACGFVNNPKHIVAVRPRPADAGGPVEIEEVWRIERAVPHIPTPLVYGTRAYLWSDAGIVTCVAAATGETVWQKRLGGNFFGSPVCVGGRLYCVNDAGEVVVLATGDSFEELTRNSLGEPSHATPAVADGVMYLRTEGRLFSLGGRSDEE
ncbi:MAG: PQQ-binding-like beta-propeller repeat protein [Planctomycetes bacterium]|nr:PQQ-binding-like beta-propeller repeat protein [Planctomycetota bacterium]